MRRSGGSTTELTAPVAVPVTHHRGFVPGLLTVGLGASLLQLPGMDVSFWRDESATASAAGRSLTELADLLGNADTGMAGYYVFIRFWAALFGTSEFALRLPSLLAGIAIVVIGGILANRLGGPVAGMAAAILLALHPIVLPAYATEARSYALATALVGGAGLAAHAASRTPAPRNLVIWSGLACLAIAGQLLTMCALAPQTIWLLRGRRIEPAGCAASIGVPAVLAGALGLMAARESVLQSWIPAVTWDSWWQLVDRLISSGWLIVLISCSALIVLSRIVNRTPTTLSSTRQVDIVVLTGWLLAPLALLTGYSLFIGPLLLDRYLLFSGVAAACLLGIGVAAALKSSLDFDSICLRVLGVALLTGALLTGVLQNVERGALRPAAKSEDLRAAAQWIRDRQQVDDGIIFAPTWSELGMRWYLGDAKVAGGGPVSPVDLLADPTKSATAAGSLWSPTGPEPADARGHFDPAAARHLCGRVFRLSGVGTGARCRLRPSQGHPAVLDAE